MKMIQVKLPRTETYAWCGNGMMIERTHNGVQLLNGHEVSDAEVNRILDTLEQKGVELIPHPDFAS